MNKMLRMVFCLILILSNVMCFASTSAHEHKKKDKPRKKHYDLALTAIFKNEGPWLKEWIEFHKLVGVQHFYLYNNLSTDNYKEVLRPYIASGEVELIDWPYKPIPNNVPDWTRIQTGAYMDALKKAKKDKVTWLAILDSDEFLFPVQEDNLVSFLSKYPKHDGMLVNWQMYGTSFVEKIPADKLMIEMLVLKAPTDYYENTFIKSIVRPEAVESITDPHKVNYKSGKHGMNSNGNVFKNSTSPFVLVDKIRINHYWCRDEDYFVTKKMPRRQEWTEGPDGQTTRRNNLNQVEDKAIFRFVQALRKRMGLS